MTDEPPLPSFGGVLDRSCAEHTSLTASLPASPGAARTAVLTAPPKPASVPTAVQEIVVLDYGGQYSQLIARRVRDCGVFSELLPHHVPLEQIAARKPRGIILSGGPASVYADGAPPLDRGLLELGVPVMGICYGMQLLVHTLGGRVEQAEVGEFGRSELHVAEPGVLLAGMPREQTCWMSHRDTVFEPPPGFTRARILERLAGGRGRRPRARDLRDPVPPRGRAHALRRGDPDALPDRDVRLRADLVGGVDRRGTGAAHPRAGRRRAGSSAASPAASTPRSRRCSCTARSASS